jgi:hypothetical protein
LDNSMKRAELAAYEAIICRIESLANSQI